MIDSVESKLLADLANGQRFTLNSEDYIREAAPPSGASGAFVCLRLRDGWRAEYAGSIYVQVGERRWT